jgi:hypothetical protein
MVLPQSDSDKLVSNEISSRSSFGKRSTVLIIEGWFI